MALNFSPACGPRSGCRFHSGNGRSDDENWLSRNTRRRGILYVAHRSRGVLWMACAFCQGALRDRQPPDACVCLPQRPPAESTRSKTITKPTSGFSLRIPFRCMIFKPFSCSLLRTRQIGRRQVRGRLVPILRSSFRVRRI